MVRPRSRRVVLPVLIVLVLSAVSVGVVYLVQRGRGSSDPFRKAIVAQQAGDLVGAELLARKVLADDPSHERARYLLIYLLATSDRIDEAEELARHWMVNADDEVKGLRVLGELALQRGDPTTALRLARIVADRDPAFAQAMLIQVQELRGTPADREGSVRAAEAMGGLASTPAVRASAFLYAAETLRDLEIAEPDAVRKAALAERRERARRAARAAVMTRIDPDAPDQLSPIAARALMGRIQLLSNDPSERRQGREELEAVLEREPDRHPARAALVRYFLTEGVPEAAAAQARLLDRAPPLVALAAVAALAAAGEAASALDVLGTLSSIPASARDRLRARILIQGPESGRAAGLDAMEALARAAPDQVELAQEALAHLHAAGETERGTALLEDLAAHEPRLRVMALTERAAALRAAGSRARLEATLGELAAIVTLADLPGIFARLQVGSSPTDTAAVEFLNRVLEAGQVDANEVRLLRAAVTISRPGDAPDGRLWAACARDDLIALGEDPDVPTRALVNAATLCVAADERDLSGVLLARALARPAEGSAALDLYVRLVADRDPTQREMVAAGMRRTAASDGAFAEWLTRLADALAAGDTTNLRRPASAPAAAAQPNATESALQLLLASQAADWPEAEAYARARLAVAGDRTEAQAREHLGAVLLGAQKFDQVLVLHEGEGRTPRHLEQRVWALRGLRRTAEALAEARALVRETEGSDRALLVLAQVLRERDPDAALAAASAVPDSVQGSFLRAELLEERGDAPAAAQVFEDMLVASRDRNQAAWEGLARLRAAEGRDGDLVRRLSTTLQAPGPALRPGELASLFLMRGQALERLQSYEEALADYNRVLSVVRDHPVALNNAAWLMSSGLVRQTTPDTQAWQEKALELVDRAVGVAPDLAPLHHTRAKILMAMGRHADALPALDKALALIGSQRAPDAGLRPVDAGSAAARGRVANYLLDKASVLRDLRRGDEARALYERVAREYPGTFQAGQALKGLEVLDR